MKEKNIHQLEGWIQTQKHIIETTKTLIEKCSDIFKADNKNINVVFLENAIASLCERIQSIQQYQLCIDALVKTIPNTSKKIKSTIDSFYEEIQTIKNGINLFILQMDNHTAKIQKQIYYTSFFKKQLTKKNNIL